ncbi:hypothetical protein OF83DRAFT_1160256 [Amylostereum chailletii]|nr:hypothetical protein OF83DRAFT_1160256 [Amylostereum chailletii]
MVSGVVTELGSLDVMVANAGLVVVDRVTEANVEDIDRLLSVNVRGTMLCYKHAAKQMIAQGKGGRIIGASSLAGKKGFGFLFTYTTTKFAVRGLTQSAAIELGKYGITVNAYSPGLVDTTMVTTMDNALAPAIGSGTLVKTLETASAIGRLGTSQDVASLVSYLASPEASFITGQSVCIDGGVHFD